MVSRYTFFKKTSTFFILICLSAAACGSETKESVPQLEKAEMNLAGKKITVELARTDEDLSMITECFLFLIVSYRLVSG
jgi:hypothetical protein